MQNNMTLFVLICLYGTWFYMFEQNNFQTCICKIHGKLTRCRISSFRLLGSRSRVDEMPDLPFLPSSCAWTQKSSWRDAGSPLPAFFMYLDPEVELTRCRISPSCLLHVLGPKKSSWRDAGSRLLVFLDPRSRVDGMPDLVFLDPRSRVDEMPDLAFSSSWSRSS